MENANSCFLCGNLSHHGGRIAELGSFQVLSDIAPLIDGHLLIATKTHYLSFSALGIEALTELKQIKELARNILIETFSGKVIFFEHGTGSICDLPACGVEHAHTHVLSVPAAENLVFGQNLLDFFNSFYAAGELQYIDIYDHMHLQLVHGKNYLFTEDIDGSKRIFFTSRRFPSQILRRYLAKYLGCEFEYDWQLFVNEEKAKNTTFYMRKKVDNINLLTG